MSVMFAVDERTLINAIHFSLSTRRGFSAALDLIGKHAASFSAAGRAEVADALATTDWPYGQVHANRLLAELRNERPPAQVPADPAA